MSDFGPVRSTTTTHPSMTRALRMVSMRVASIAGLTVDRVEDVALATGEAFAIATSSPEAAEIEFEIGTESGVVTATLTARSATHAPVHRFGRVTDLTDRALRTVTDTLVYDEPNGRIQFTVG